MKVHAKFVMAHPHLNANSTQTAMALVERDMLREFHTSLDLTRLSEALGEGAFKRSLQRRSLPRSLSSITTAHPWQEVARLARRSMGVPHRGTYAPDATAHAVDRAVSRSLRDSDAGVYAFEDSALRSFERAHELGIQKVYDLPIGYWLAAEEIFAAEREINPEWAKTLATEGINNQAERLRRKDMELMLADKIVVASTFTKKTLELANVEKSRVNVVPYGSPSPDLRVTKVDPDRTLRVLFVGALSQRKGLSYLFEAVLPLRNHIQLTLVGRLPADAGVIRSAIDAVGARWIPSLTHDEVLAEMNRNDVFVFPSLFEGFGLVLTEALSRGLPIIATPHTAAPDLITDGEEGWTVPIRSAEDIRARLELLLSDRSLLADMRTAALDLARHRRWSSFRAEIAQILLDT